MRAVKVVFASSTKHYDYFCIDESIKSGDFVAVGSQYGDFHIGVAKVVQVLARGSKKAERHILCKIDKETYAEKLKLILEEEEIVAKLDSKLDKQQREKQFGQLLDPESMALKQRLAELRGENNVIPADQ